MLEGKTLNVRLRTERGMPSAGRERGGDRDRPGLGADQRGERGPRERTEYDIDERKLYVAGLPSHTNEEMLRRAFEP